MNWHHYDHVTDVDSIMNFETINFRNQGKRYRRTIVGVSGGVEFDFRRIKPSNKTDAQLPSDILDGNAEQAPSVNPSPRGSSDWWWDAREAPSPPPNSGKVCRK